ncbi:MAG: hypothetical protein Q8J78_06695 [Moraxellaceae bacterium]|nr:hypothetical protein [Moraxellaceae bacterium]
MPKPNDARECFHAGIAVSGTPSGIIPSPDLVDLLVRSREDYDWPANTGSTASQARIIALMASVSERLNDLTPASAHQIVIDVSKWAGNNKISHRRLEAATQTETLAMRTAIHDLLNSATEVHGLESLSRLPGLSLVISSKIYRFCCPIVGAAVDRHASYFFNSLPHSEKIFATNFRRQWAKKPGGTTRLSTYTAPSLSYNTKEFFQAYIPLLKNISDHLNAYGHTYRCASLESHQKWTPADVEMASYYWWAQNGAR